MKPQSHNLSRPFGKVHRKKIFVSFVVKNKNKMKNLILFFLMAFTTSAFAQSKIGIPPTTELYGYYQKDQNFKTIQPKIEDYEALMAFMGYIFTRGNIHSESDYTLLWSYKFEGRGEINAQIRYQFLIPYFKITVEHIIATFPNGNMTSITLDSKDKEIRQTYIGLYDVLVGNLIKEIKPAKTVTKEQFREALNSLDKMPEINTDKN